MTDIKSISQKASGESDLKNSGSPVLPEHVSDREKEELIAFMELLFFAYRDFISDPDLILNALEFGRPHHRILHFIAREPGLRVADLLNILKITKQSLAPVLKQLIDEDYIRQEAGKLDRRERRLFPTEKGLEFSGKLMEPQLVRIRQSLQKIKPEDHSHISRFLYEMIEADDQADVAHRIKKSARDILNLK